MATFPILHRKWQLSGVAVLARGAQCYLRASKQLVGCSLWEGRDGALVSQSSPEVSTHGGGGGRVGGADAAADGAGGAGPDGPDGSDGGGGGGGGAMATTSDHTAHWRLDLSEGPERVRGRLTRHHDFDMLYGFNDFAPPVSYTELRGVTRSYT